MKRFWTTTAALTALLTIGATGADAAHRHRKPAAEAAESDNAAAEESVADAKPSSARSRRAARRQHATEAAAKASAVLRGRTAHSKEAAEAAAAPAAPSRGRLSRTASTRAERRAAAKAEAAEAEATARAARQGPVKNEAPEPVTVGKGDTLYALSRKTGVDRDTIAKLNGLKPPYHLMPGQAIKLPSRRFYAAQKGDTLTSVAKKLGTEPVSLAAYNESDLNKRVRAGDKIYVPEDVTAPEPAKPSRQAANHKAAPSPSNGRGKATQVAAAEEAPSSRRRTAHATTPAPRRTASAATTPAPASVITPSPAMSPAVRYAEARPYVPTPTQPRPALTQAPADGLDAAIGLAPADTAPVSAAAAASPSPSPSRPSSSPSPSPGASTGVSIALPTQAARATPATASAPTRQVATARTDAAISLRPAAPQPRPQVVQQRPQPPAYIRPSYAPPRVAPEGQSSGFQMTPPTQEMASNTRAPSSTAAPYTTLGPSSDGRRSNGRDRQGRPTTLPPQVAMEAPSSQPPILQASPAPSLGDIVAAGRGRFVWPVRGAVLSGFGRKGGGQSNDGLNISAQPGEAVRASAAGEVVYAGDQVPSFGNLVLVKHANGWVTAYAHMSGITVKNRDQVAQGQQIGLAGNTGNVGVTQLHFEMRYSPSVRDKATPIDPMLILPSL